MPITFSCGTTGFTLPVYSLYAKSYNAKSSFVISIAIATPPVGLIGPIYLAPKESDILL